MSNYQITKPVMLGNLELPNRLVLPPVTIFKASEEGLIGEVSLQHYREKTEGGAFGLVIVEHSYVSREGRASAGQVSAAEDRTIDGLRQVAETIHRNGSRAVLQLNHAGGYTSREVTGSQPMAPSALRLHPQYTDIPRVMTKEDILAVEEAFVRAAERTKAAGFDGVEIHSAHTYLLNEFYSPLSNRRTDEYGAASMENRLRIHTEILQKVRGAVGADFPILIRLGGCDYQEGGSTIEDAVAAGVLLQAAGADAIDLSGGLCRYILPDRKEPGYFRDMSIAVQAAVSVPVILTGGVKTVRQAEQLLRDGAADMIGIGRAAMTDYASIRLEMDQLRAAT